MATAEEDRSASREGRGEEFARQFELTRDQYVDKLDFLNWFRYFHIIKDILRLAPARVLEIGTGDGFVRRIVEPEVDCFRVMDVNERLSPEYLRDVRDRDPALEAAFDLVLAADVLEHIEFAELGGVLGNIHSYLAPGGHFLATIPHRRSYFLFMSPTYVPHVLAVPTGFLSPGAFYRRFIKRRIWIDPHHCWEIGDGRIKRHHVEDAFRGSGFEIVRRRSLLYVDYWVLRKPT